MATEAHAALAQWTADASATKTCPRCAGKQYHHGFGEHGRDPDWCSECGGAGFVAAFSEIEQMQRALDAAASVRAEVGMDGMEILRLVAAIPLWRDRYPDAEKDVVSAETLVSVGVTARHVRAARAVVAAAERKEVMPDRMDDASRQHDATSSPTHLATPPTAGPSPVEGAPNRPLTVTIVLPEGYKDADEFAADGGFQLATSPEAIWFEFVDACEAIEAEAEKETELVKKTFAEFHFQRARMATAKSIRRSVVHPKYRSGF